MPERRLITAAMVGVLAFGISESKRPVYAQAAPPLSPAYALLLNGERIPLGEHSEKYYCIGTLKTVLGNLISIIRIRSTSRSENMLIIFEQGPNGVQMNRYSIPLDPPSYTPPSELEVFDAVGNSYICLVDVFGNYTFSGESNVVVNPTPTRMGFATRTSTPTDTPVPTATPTSTPPPSSTPFPTRIPTVPPVPTEDPFSSQQAFAHAVATVDAASANRSAPPGKVCLDSYGNEVQLGEQRPNDDDCISVSVDVPSKGHITYTYQGEPDASGKKNMIDVVLKPNGQIYWSFVERPQSQTTPVTKPQDLPGQILEMLRKAVAFLTQSGPDMASIEAVSQLKVSDLPKQSELPRGVVTDATLSWYDTVMPIALLFNYDPRTHLAFVQIESKGINHLTSYAAAQGLVQIIPDTWALIRNTINNNPELLEKARKVGVEPNSANPWVPTDNFFFSAVYLTWYCGLPQGKIPMGWAQQAYVEGAAKSSKRYHDGHGSDNLTTSPKGQEYMATMRVLIPAIAGPFVPTPQPQ